MAFRGKRYLSDYHPDLIMLWQALQGGWEPPTVVTEDDYKAAKDGPPSALRGFIGFACSWGGKFMAGYARDPSSDRNYALEGHNTLKKKIKILQECEFSHKPYWDIKPNNSLVYIDIPYKGTTEYSTEKFDHSKFWSWVKEQSLCNIIIVSEYSAPEDCKCIASFPTKTDLSCGKDNHKEPRIERLFTYNDIAL